MSRRASGNRVLMLVENNSYPGDPRVRAEATTLAQAGYRVSVIAPAREGQPARERVGSVEVFRYVPRHAGAGASGYVREYLRATVATAALSLRVACTVGFDIIHAHNPPDLFVVLAAFYRVFGKRFVFDHHDLAPEMYCARFDRPPRGIVFRMLLLFEWLSCRLACHVIATNQSYCDVDRTRNGVSPHRITIVRNGPDLDRLNPVEPDAALRARAPHIFGYVGVLGSQDGVDYLVRALHHLKTDIGRTDWYCVIVGKGDALPALKQLAAQYALEDRVWFTGFIPDADLLRYLSTCDICVDPDPSNPFNDKSTMIKMMEYMALGKPIVAFDLLEHRRTAADTAVYVRPNDELEFARALARLMDDPARRQEMGAKGRHRVETVLAWRYSAASLLDAYARIRGVVETPAVPGPARVHPPGRTGIAGGVASHDYDNAALVPDDNVASGMGVILRPAEFDVLARKVRRNIEDVGIGMMLRKALAHLCGPLWFRQHYRIYRIDLESAPRDARPGRADLTLRLLEPDETARIAQVENLAEWLEGKVSDRIRRGDLCVVALDPAGCVAGFNLITFGTVHIPLINLNRTFRRGDAWSEHVAVRRDLRQHGIGTSLRFRAFEELRARGCVRFYGGALASNVKSLALARRMGFHEIVDVTYTRVLGREHWRFKRIRP